MIKDFLVYTINNLKNRRLRSWLTMIGIFIGIAAVVSLIGLGEGLRTAISSQFGFLGTDILTVQASGLGYAGPPGFGTAEPLSEELAPEIAKIPGIESSVGRYLESATMEFNDVQDISMAVSIPDGKDRRILEKMLNIQADKGRLLKDGDGKKIVLGHNFADDENTFGKAIRSGDRVLLNGIKFEVVGIMEEKGNFFMDQAVVVNTPVMIDHLGTDEEEVDVISIKVKDVDNIAKIKLEIEDLLRKERNVDEGEENFIVESPQQTLESLNSTLFAVQLFIYIIAGISLAVGGIGIMNTMFTSVLERTKEIGIMKSIGARNSMIFSLFFIESGFLGMVGGIIGILLGLTFAYGLAFLGKLALGSDLIQAHVSLFVILGSLAFSFGLGTVFGVLPALRASRLQPVESLRSVQ